MAFVWRLLHINPDIICSIIQYSREFQAKEEVTMPESTPESEYEYDWAQILADHQDDLTYLEMKSSIDGFTYQQKIDLLALLYLGREDAATLDDAREQAIENPPSNLVDYLLAHPLLSNYLENALGLFGQSCNS